MYITVHMWEDHSFTVACTPGKREGSIQAEISTERSRATLVMTFEQAESVANELSRECPGAGVLTPVPSAGKVFQSVYATAYFDNAKHFSVKASPAFRLGLIKLELQAFGRYTLGLSDTQAATLVEALRRERAPAQQEVANVTTQAKAEEFDF